MYRFNRTQIHRNIYLFGLAFMITCLPLSLYLLSVSQFLLALNWIAEGDFSRKAGILRRNKQLLLFISVFFVYLIGYRFSENKQEALFHLKNALPLLALPVIIGTSPAPGDRNVLRLLLLFCSGVIAAAMACLINYLINGLPPGGDFRHLSIFIPHLRFAMMIVMAIVILIAAAVAEINVIPLVNIRVQKFVYLPAALFLLLFLFFLRSVTGIVLLVAVTMVLLFYRLYVIRRTAIRNAAFIALVAVFAAVLSLALYSWFRNFHPRPVDFGKLDNFTVNGNPYVHDTSSRLLENGHYIEIYLCEPEMKREWEKRSNISYDSTDIRNQPVKSTLKRYLTSKGLRKDSLSVIQLTDEDIGKIENGLANYRFSIHSGIHQRFYETLYEIHVYSATGFVELHSFGQRLAFLRASMDVISEKPLTGYGTGDVYEVLVDKVQLNGITVDPTWKGKPHNQFAFYLIAFGIPGLLWIMFCWIYPVFRNRADILFSAFALIMLLSMMVMDTHESYSTMVFFALFYSLLIFGKGAGDGLFKPE